MKADKSTMFSITLDKLRAGGPAPAPLYVFLQRNDRMVPVRLRGDPVETAFLESLMRKEHTELWVPHGYEEAISAYLAYLEKTGSAPLTLDELEAPRIGDSGSANIAAKSAPAAEAGLSPEDAPALKEEILEAIESGSAAESLRPLAKKLLEQFRAVATAEPAAYAAPAEGARAFLDTILETIDTDLGKNILALRRMESATQHSVIVGSLAALIACASPNVELDTLAELAAAATFHDIGVATLPNELLRKSKTGRDAGETAAYERHAQLSAAILERSVDKFPENVVRMVREHHSEEGGPTKLLDASRSLILANLLDGFCNGDETGARMSPNEAFSRLFSAPPETKQSALLKTFLEES